MSFPRYPAYKDSGVDWLGPIPTSWSICALKRIASLQSGESITSEQIEVDGTYPVYGGNGLRGYCEAFTHDGEFALIGRQGALCGNINYARGKFWASEHAVVVTPKQAVATKWIGELLRAMNLNQYSVSAAQPGLSVEIVGNLGIPLPSSDEQVAIANFLDRETAKIDTLVAEQEQLITLLKEKRQAVISHAVTKGLDPSVPMKDSGVEWLGEIPAHWEVKRIKDCGCEVVDCKNRTPEPHIDGEYFVVRTSCVKDGEFNPEPGYWTDEENFIEWTAKGRPQVGDVLFTREAPTGEACLAPEGLDFCLGQRMMYIRPPKEALLSEFLLYSIYGGLARERINEKSKGSTVGHLRVGEVGELPLLLPPMEEQQALVRFLGEELAKLRALAAQAEDAIALMTERRSALISAAVTGQIDVRGLLEQTAKVLA